MLESQEGKFLLCPEPNSVGVEEGPAPKENPVEGGLAAVAPKVGVVLPKGVVPVPKPSDCTGQEISQPAGYRLGIVML